MKDSLADRFWAIIWNAYTCEEEQRLHLFADYAFRLVEEGQAIRSKKTRRLEG